MDMTVLILVVTGVLGIFYVVLTWGNNKNDKTKHEINNNVKKVDTKKIDKKEVAKAEAEKKKSEIQRKDMFNFIEFDKISDDMILQEKETKYTMIIQCKGINYDLMSEIEQLSVEEGFITFLNTLKSPIQIYVQARAINLKDSLDMFKNSVDDINRKFSDSVDKYKKLTSDINTTEEELREASLQREKFANISEYAQDITRYVEKLSLNKHMLQRKFYIAISYYKSEVNSVANFSEREIHDICYRELYTRAQSIIGALQSCSVSARVLNSNELAELLYISYNRDDEKLLDIKTALDSGFYRMYSTTKDIQLKKQEALQKQIQTEAMYRVEQAIKVAINNGIIKSQDQMVEEYENATDIEAIKIIEDTNINEEEKKKIQQVIVEQHNMGVDQRIKEREKNKKDKELSKEIDEDKEENKSEMDAKKTIINDNIDLDATNSYKINNTDVNINKIQNEKINNNNQNDSSSENDESDNKKSNTNAFDDLIV